MGTSFEKEYNEVKLKNDTLSKEIQNLKLEILKPDKERETKLKFLWDLDLKMKIIEKPILIGQKGMGKSTFFYGY